ncbi:MAG: S41 family peptidase [Candidatus Enterenecus sp.]
MKKILRRLGAAALALTVLCSTAYALTVDEAIGLLEENYLRRLPEEVYEAQTLEELFSIVGDPYTYYMSEEEYQAFLSSVEDTVEVTGIGVSIQFTAQGILVGDTLKGGSAREAGILPGDLIVAVDGVSCVPADESYRAMILGEPGTFVTVTVLRDGVTMDFTLERRLVVVTNTETTLVDGHIGYIRCSSFGQNTGALFLEGIQACGDEADCWLVDLRGNSGGYTTAAVETIGAFAGAGFHLYLRDSGGQLYYYLYGQDAATDRTAVILVNSATASASEAFAGGMRDYGLGITVGSRTYGKGVAQIVFDEDNRPEYFDGDAMKLTAYRFYSAGGVTNDLVGVIPLLMVSDEAAEAVALAVCGDPASAEEDRLMVELGGYLMLVDLSATDADTLAALFEALPPSAVLWQYGSLEPLSVVEMAAELGVSYQSRWFDDVAESEYADAINTLATYGIVHGNGKGMFYPGSTLKRSEVCAMLGKALGLSVSTRQQFDDVPADAWYAGWVNAMAELGLVQGAGNGKFYPNEPLKQEEYLTILGRVARYLSMNFDYAADSVTQEQLDGAEAQGFHAWACQSVALLDMGEALFAPVEELEPGAAILREEAAYSLYALLAAAGILAV